MIALLIVDFLHAVLLDVGAVDGFSIVIRHVSSLACLRNGVVVIVDEAYELPALLVCDLDVLADHSLLEC